MRLGGKMREAAFLSIPVRPKVVSQVPLPTSRAQGKRGAATINVRVIAQDDRPPASARARLQCRGKEVGGGELMMFALPVDGARPRLRVVRVRPTD